MIRAYDKTYLSYAQAAFGRMLDFAVYDLGYESTNFFKLLLCSGVANDFEIGEPNAVVGKSGEELAYEVLERYAVSHERVKPRYSVSRSEEYWMGWALAYYQWYSARSFSDIVGTIPIEDIRAMDMPYHEMDIRQFVDRMDELYRKAHPDTRLKKRCESVWDSVKGNWPGFPVYRCERSNSMSSVGRVSTRRRGSTCFNWHRLCAAMRRICWNDRALAVPGPHYLRLHSQTQQGRNGRDAFKLPYWQRTKSSNEQQNKLR